MLPFLMYFIVLAVVQIVYLKLARKYGIYDIPNHRSSHRYSVIRGGGIVIYASILLHQLANDFSYKFFFLGITIVSLVSFRDDISHLSNYKRILSHVIGITLLLYQIQLPLTWWSPMVLIVSIGVMNTFNFMDGINGITGFYGLVTMASFLIINQLYVEFVDTELIILAIMGLAVFGYGNFRKRAIWFAGDVGSMALAFIVIFGIIQLVMITGNISLILLLAVYGVDSVLTIILRLWRKENIFQAHRSHLYQYLANTNKLPHLQVAGMYALLQAFINILVLYNLKYELLNSYVMFTGVISLLSVIYFILITVVIGKPIFKRAS